MVDYSKVHFLPQLKIKEYESVVNTVTSPNLYDKYTDIERSEAYETLGIVQYYNGDYPESLKNLKIAIDKNYLPLKSPHRICMVKILLGCIYYRCDDDAIAKEYFFAVNQISKRNNYTEFHSISLCNLALVYSKQFKYKEAILVAREALSHAGLIYPKKSEYFLQYVRVLLSIYIKTADYSKAEVLVNEYELSFRGMKFSMKDQVGALNILLSYLKDPENFQHGTKSEPKEVIGSLDHSTGMKDEENVTGLESDLKETVILGSKTQREQSQFLSDVNDQLFDAIISYNLQHLLKGVMDKETLCQLEKLPDPVETIRHTIQNFQMKRQQMNLSQMQMAQTYLKDPTRQLTFQTPSDFSSQPLSPQDPYYHLHYDEHPCYINCEQSIYPSLILSVLLMSQFQTDLVTEKGFAIESMMLQSGEVPDDYEKISILLDQYALQLKNNSLSNITGNQPALLASKVVPETELTAVAAMIYPIPTSKPATAATAKIDPNEEDDNGDNFLIHPKVMTPSNKESRSRPSSQYRTNSTRRNTSSLTNVGKSMTSVSTALNDEDIIVKEPDIIVIQRLISNYNELQHFNKIRDDIPSIEGMNGSSNKYSKTLVSRLQQQYNINLSDETARITAFGDDSTVATGFTNLSSVKGKDSKLNLRKQSSMDSHLLSSDYPQSSGVLSASTNKDFEQLFSPSKQQPSMSYNSISNNSDVAESYTHNIIDIDGMTALVLNDNYSMLSETTILIDYLAQDQVGTWLKWAYSNCGSFSYGVLGHSCIDPLPSVGFNYSTQQNETFLYELRNRLLDLENLLITPPEHLKVFNAKAINIETRIILYFLLVKVSVQLNMKKETGSTLLQLEELCQLFQIQHYGSPDSLFYCAMVLKFRIDYEEWCRALDASAAWLITQIEHHGLLRHYQYIAAALATTDSEMIRDAYRKIMNLYIILSQIPFNDQETQRLVKDTVSMDELKSLPDKKMMELIHKDFAWIHINSKNLAIKYLYVMMNATKEYIMLYEDEQE